MPRLQTQLLRTALTLLLLAALMLLPWKLTASSAGWVAGGGLGCLLMFAMLSIGGIRKYLHAIVPASVSDAASKLETTVLLVGFVRRAGIAPLGLVFLLAWSLIYMGLWALDPQACPADLSQECQGALAGAGDTVAVGKFMVLSINLLAANPPADFFPVASLSQALAALQLLSGLALLTFGATAFFGFKSEAGSNQGGKSGAPANGEEDR